eukprot:15846271-Heterocapsa_arctica.AAC.1
MTTSLRQCTAQNRATCRGPRQNKYWTWQFVDLALSSLIWSSASQNNMTRARPRTGRHGGLQIAARAVLWVDDLYLNIT